MNYSSDFAVYQLASDIVGMTTKSGNIMKVAIVFFLFLISASARSQAPDSAWLADSILPKYYIDTGTVFPASVFVDEKGNSKTLADY